jgi:O-antigen/teichoic acid export membrane protein
MFGWIFVIFAGVMIVCGLTLAGFMAYAGRCLTQRRRYTLCLVVAALSCMLMPFGTVLGIFTLIVLMRPPVKAAFA